MDNAKRVSRESISQAASLPSMQDASKQVEVQVGKLAGTWKTYSETHRKPKGKEEIKAWADEARGIVSSNCATLTKEMSKASKAWSTLEPKLKELDQDLRGRIRNIEKELKGIGKKKKSTPEYRMKKKQLALLKQYRVRVKKEHKHSQKLSRNLASYKNRVGEKQHSLENRLKKSKGFIFRRQARVNKIFDGLGKVMGDLNTQATELAAGYSTDSKNYDEIHTATDNLKKVYDLRMTAFKEIESVEEKIDAASLTLGKGGGIRKTAFFNEFQRCRKDLLDLRRALKTDEFHLRKWTVDNAGDSAATALAKDEITAKARSAQLEVVKIRLQVLETLVNAFIGGAETKKKAGRVARTSGVFPGTEIAPEVETAVSRDLVTVGKMFTAIDQIDRDLAELDPVKYQKNMKDPEIKKMKPRFYTTSKSGPAAKADLIKKLNGHRIGLETLAGNSFDTLVKSALEESGGGTTGEVEKGHVAVMADKDLQELLEENQQEQETLVENHRAQGWKEAKGWLKPKYGQKLATEFTNLVAGLFKKSGAGKGTATEMLSMTEKTGSKILKKLGSQKKKDQKAQLLDLITVDIYQITQGVQLMQKGEGARLSPRQKELLGEYAPEDKKKELQGLSLVTEKEPPKPRTPPKRPSQPPTAIRERQKKAQQLKSQAERAKKTELQEQPQLAVSQLKPPPPPPPPPNKQDES